jgi:hypothetical protein
MLAQPSHDGVSAWLLALFGQSFAERALVINLSGPFKDADGKRFMFTRGV